jgi:hypothetical protein
MQFLHFSSIAILTFDPKNKNKIHFVKNILEIQYSITKVPVFGRNVLPPKKKKNSKN